MRKNEMFAVEAPSAICDERLRSFAVLLSGDLNAYCTRPRTEHARYAAERQLVRSRKKFAISDNAIALHRKAVDDFLAINEQAGSILPNLDPRIVADARHFIFVALSRFTSANSSGNVQGVLDLGMLLRMWKHGPGKSNGVRGTHFVSKSLEGRNTVTRRALRFAQLLRNLDPHLAGSDATSGCEFMIVRGSRLSSVHKNEDTRRTIASEPLWNMALQLAGGMYIEGALRTVGLDLSTQPEINKFLAWVGTFCRELATLDLKNASDLIVLKLIKLLWPMEWYHFLSAIRSEEIKVPGHGWIPLNMLSTMGNGFTFPVMTMTLLALVYAVQSQRIEKSMYWDKANTGVFGDDIIVPTCDFEAVKEVLAGAGLIVNNEKSYATGSFRESCGGDYYKGKNVTPFYVKSLSSDPEIYTAINQLLVWSIRHRIPCGNAYRYLVSILSVDEPFFVPMWEAPFAGIRTASVGRRYKYWEVCRKDKRLNLDHVNEYIAMQFIVGMYVASTSGFSVCYTPRHKRTRYVEKLARLPRGYLDGSDPRLRSSETELWVFLHYGVGRPHPGGVAVP